MSRWWCVLALLVGWLALPIGARADEGRCAAAWSLPGVGSADQARLHELCEERGRPGPGLLPVLSAVATRGTWDSAALGRLLAGAAPHLDLGASKEHAAQEQRLRALRRALQAGLVARRAGPSARGDGRCGWVREALDAYAGDLAAREVPVPPIAGWALAGERCLSLDPEALGEVHFLTIAADAVSSLTVTAATTDRLVVQWLGADEAITHAGRRLFVVAVPRGSVATVEARQRDAMAAAWHGFVAADLTIWDAPPGASCLRISIDLDADTTLLLDGQPLTRGRSLAHRTVGVLGERHELVALRCAADERGRERCATVFREALESSRAPARNLCQDVAIDLHARQSVAVLGAEAAPGCDQGLAFQVEARAAEVLKAAEASTGRVFRDLKAVASATEALGSLRASLNPSAGQALGARTGSDTYDQLGSVAKEAWRQGIDALLSFELRCEGGAYRVVGSKLAVGELLRRQRGEVGGIDLQEMLAVESVGLRQAALLGPAVASVIDRLFGRDYLRIFGGGATLPYRRQAALVIEQFRAGRAADGGLPAAPVVEALHVADEDRPPPPICGQLARVDGSSQPRMAAVQALLAGRPRRGGARVTIARADGGTDEADDRSTSYVAKVRASWPGTYLVAVRWPGEAAPADAVCVRFEVRAGEAWGSVGFATGLTTRAGIAAYQWVHVRLMLGRTWYLPRPWIGFGISGGYSFGRFYHADGLPTWQDVATSPAGSGAPFRWQRHAVVLGPVIELRTRRATWPVELRARAMLAGGVAWVDVSDLPPQFVTFVTADPFNTPNTRLTPNLDATLDLGVSYSIGRVSIGHTLLFGAIAFNELASQRNAATALNSGGLLLGLNLTIGGAL